ncbi:Galactose oxidase/kelch repeat superfamily protein [Rhynchospora pubera]|uniref:Galactose oxidase/kelch repeat superfamily protein n=1 Tax=Rhynchospora pubera TaxID=906938 RepID=A0AAV8BS86_9POAL|nr:Galactose oxidase/kelch repeat superfamily protein [Rhynchospora pubera]
MTNLLEFSSKRVKKQQVQPEPEPIDAALGCQIGNGSKDDSGFCDSNSLIGPIGRDNSITCLLCCSRSEYGSLACLNRSFRSLIQGGELYRLRRQLGIVEHWVYFYCDDTNNWDAYDPKEKRWITVPPMPNDECFKCAGKKWDVAQNMPSECFKCNAKESIAVGTELLVFGEVSEEQIGLRYSILSNSWTYGVRMNQPRYQFASASLGEKAIVAGGFDKFDNVLNSAELYNSDTRCWVTLPSMNKARSMCSGVFMDGKFYVVGGASSDEDILTCGEEYDLEKQSWRVIPNMAAGLNRGAGLPPLVAVLRNELYTADCLEWVLKKYDKKSNVWVTLGPMPLKPGMREFFNVAFCACGDRLLYTNDFRVYRGGRIWINSCVPDNDGPPQWNIITERDGIEVTSCIAMGC